MLNEINPYIRVAAPSVFPPHHRIKPRIIFDYELIYIENGAFTFIYDGISYSVGPNTVLFICPNVTHEFIINEQSVSQPHIHFDMTFDAISREVYVSFSARDKLTSKETTMIRKNLFLGRQTSPILSLSHPEAFVQTFFSVIQAPNKQDLRTKADMLTLIHAIFEDNFPTLLKSRAQQNALAKSIKDFLDRNCDEPLSLERIAAFFSYNKYYLDRCFVKEYGISVIKYRNQKRIELAKALLAEHSVTEVAERLGFTSIYVFSRAFKDHVGISPTVFRNNLRSDS